MARNTQSIDGFTLKRRDNASLEAADQHIFLDAVPPITPNRPAPSVGLQKADIVQESTLSLANDVETTLQSLEVEPDELPELVKESRRAKKRRQRQLRQNRKHAKRRQRHPIRRLIKWFFITILALLFALIGWLAFKAIITGGKIFQGSWLDIFTSKARLAEDKNGRTNILIFGTEGYSIDSSKEDGALLTDSIMVMSLNQTTHDAYMISLPRDLWVQRTCPALGTNAGKLNEIYYCNYASLQHTKDEEYAAKYFREVAGKIVGLDIQYFVHLNYQALLDAVDAVGGVEVVIESSDPRGIYDIGTGIKYPNGPVYLNGEQALALARARGAWGGYGLPGSNFDREHYQQKILTALQQKALSAGTLANPVAINSLLDALGDNLRTNFKTSEVQTLLELARNIKSNDMISLPLINREDGGSNLVMTGMSGEVSIVRPIRGLYDYSEIIDYVARSTSANPVTREAAKIDVLNGSTQVGLAQNQADELKAAGYLINKVTNAPTAISDPVKIYQINTSKTATAAALEKYFGVKVIRGQLAGYDSAADFVIVVGVAS
ncbi:LCP family protein [Candidatus Saccharibacteria bacterium]|nr:LCP family protein [Candidatus Saccharibacteria bacterium]